MAARLTVIIAVKNHRRWIRDCVESCRHVADEILIADSGATDGTVELAKRLCQGWCDCRVVAREYITACSFKNWAIAQASHPWVLILDVDERVSGPLAAEVAALLDDQPACDAYQIRRHNYFMGHRVRFAEWARDRIIRLIRRDLFQYPNEAADHGEFLTGGHSIGLLKHPLEHYARSSYDEQLEKCNRYSAIQAQRWHEEGRRPSLFQLLFRPPARFLRSYIAYGGFLDGKIGVQIAYLAAYYAFLKQARLWELECGRHTDTQDDETEPRQAA